jgi:hypothetical protein
MVSYAGEPASGQRSHQHLTSQQKEIIFVKCICHVQAGSWKNMDACPIQEHVRKFKLYRKTKSLPPILKTHGFYIH